MGNDELKELIEMLEKAKADLENVNFKSRVDRRECNKCYRDIQKALAIAKSLDEPMVKVVK